MNEIDFRQSVQSILDGVRHEHGSTPLSNDAAESFGLGEGATLADLDDMTLMSVMYLDAMRTIRNLEAKRRGQTMNRQARRARSRAHRNN